MHHKVMKVRLERSGMFIVYLIFASLGMCGSVFIAAMFLLNHKEIERKAINDAEKLMAVQRAKSGRRCLPSDKSTDPL